MLYQMVLIRRFEEKSAESYTLGKIGGFCHLYIGQEAVAVGSLSALRPDDYVFTSYRDHGHALAMGTSPDEVMAELYGKIGGCSKGKGGSMHLFDADKHFLGGHGIVGGQIPLATGVAYATKYRGTDQATLVFFGEAAVNQGAFHESLNMAQLWKLPCIYICENNQYGMGTSLKPRDVDQRRVAEGGRLRDGVGVRGRHGRARRARRDGARGRARAQGVPAVAARDSHLPLHGSLDVRPRPLPHARRDRAAIRSATPSRSSATTCARRASSTTPGSRRSKTACARRSSAPSSSPTRAPSRRPRSFSRTSTPHRSKSSEW